MNDGIQVYEGKDEIPSDIQAAFRKLRELEAENEDLRERLRDEVNRRQQAETKLWQIESIVAAKPEPIFDPKNPDGNDPLAVPAEYMLDRKLHDRETIEWPKTVNEKWQQMVNKVMHKPFEGE